MKTIKDYINESTFRSRSGDSIHMPDVTLTGAVKDAVVREYVKGFFKTDIKLETTDDVKSSDNDSFPKGIYWITCFDKNEKIKAGDTISVKCTVGDFKQLTTGSSRIKNI